MQLQSHHHYPLAGKVPARDLAIHSPVWYNDAVWEWHEDPWVSGYLWGYTP
jgi:hypothetical protein